MKTIDEVLDFLKKSMFISTDTELAKELEVARTTIAGWRNRGVIPYELLVGYCEHHEISLDSLFFGKPDEEEYMRTIYTYDRALPIDDKFKIPYKDSEPLIKLNYDVFNKQKVLSANVFGYEVIDDKMFPLFNKLDYLLIDREITKHNDKYIVNSGVYALLINGFIEIREVYFPTLNSVDKYVSIKCKNERYENLTIHLNELDIAESGHYGHEPTNIYLVGKVIMSLKSEDPDINFLRL